jgi:hypothetical protein
MDMWKVMDPAQLTREERAKALSSLLLLKERRGKKIKGRACINGVPQREYISKEDATARHIHRGIIKVPAVSTLCYIHLQVVWQTQGQRYSTIQLPCITRNVTHN